MTDSAVASREPAADFDWRAILSTLVARAVRGRVPLPREELLSLAGVALARARHRYDPARATCSLREWLYSQGWRYLLSEIRDESRRRRAREVTFTDFDPDGQFVPPGRGGIDSVPAAVCLRALLDGLTADERTLVRLRLERRTHAEIGDLCGLSRETVRTRLRRIGLRIRAGGLGGV